MTGRFSSSYRLTVARTTLALVLAAWLGAPFARADDAEPEKPPVDDPAPPKPAEPPKEEPPKEDPPAEPDKPKDEKPEDSKKDDKAAKKDAAKEEPKKEKKPAIPPNSIEARVKGQQKMEGLFPLYRDTRTGALRMEIAAKQLDRDFIYVSQVSDGVLEGGHFRGQYRQQKVFRFVRHFDRIEVIESNPYFYYDPESPLARSAGANISPAVIDVLKIEAASGKDGEKRYLVRADGLFVDESFDPVKPMGSQGNNNGGGFSLGKLDKARSRVSLIRNYPENTGVVVDYVYVNPSPNNPGSGFEITDPRVVTVKVAQTLLAMPEPGFTPRLNDPRVGFFLDYQNDLTSTDITPWRDMISHWRLEKKDPTAPISDPVKPIVWWIENTTPLELRPIIEKAALSWNKAFEAAGFSNVIKVNIQPDDADWDADDIRYNVIRWVASPQPPFSGYGPRFTNPLTGEILGADIILEYSTLAQLMQVRDVFEGDAADAAWTSQSFEAKAANTDPRQMQDHCELGDILHQNLNYAMALSAVFDRPDDERKRLLEQTVAYLVTHELGHTLGLTHNMMASQSLPYADAFKREGGVKLGSVMDYPAINFAPPGVPQGDYFPTAPGAYDIWAIRFGYDPSMQDAGTRAGHLARSTEKALAFANDADDMRAPGKGIDPRVNLNDLTDDSLRYAADRLALDRKALGEIASRMVKPGESYQALRNAYLILTGDMATQGRIISRYIGGVYVDKAVAGQKGATAPYIPVPLEKQREAMKLLRDNIFAPDAFKVDASLLQQLGIERRGFFHFFNTDDPKPIARVANIQALILYHLLHPVTLLRMTDSGLYGNEYPAVRMMTDLTEAIFDADSRGSVNSYRQELQTLYVQLLMIIMQGGDHDYVARAAALSNLRAIRNDMSRWRGDLATQAHRDHLAFLIDKALDTGRS